MQSYIVCLADIICCVRGKQRDNLHLLYAQLCNTCFVLLVTSFHSRLQRGRNSMHGYPMVYLSLIICGGDSAEPRGSRRLWIRLRWWDLSLSVEVDSFCLQIHYLHPHQCNTRLLRATDSSSDSVCVRITHLYEAYAGCIYSICVCLCACIQLLLPSFYWGLNAAPDVETANKGNSN